MNHNYSKILLTSVCKPIGPSVGDGESVGYELLHGQVTRSQGIYSPRVVHKQFSLDYIAENLDCPSTVLHYPSKKTFIKHLKKKPEFVGISFVLSTVHHMKAMSRLVRKYAPEAKIILGGYGAVMGDDEALEYGDFLCKEEGVGYMRKLLGQKKLNPMSYQHPKIRSRLRIFGIPVSHTTMVFAGLGCPNGCDFCCTSHFFKREHVKLLPSGDRLFEVMKQDKIDDPDMDHTILDEDFLLDRKRSGRFLELCRKENRSFSTFAFGSVKALSMYTFEELLEMGIDGVWVGYEGKKSGYEKHEGHNIDQLIIDLQDHGITVLTSMILGIPYQSEEIATHEFGQLIETRPTLTQFLIYGPTPGTPFYENVIKDNLLNEDLLSDRSKYYKKCTGFYSMVKHPFMKAEDIENLQRDFYKEDFVRLGPSIFRVADVKWKGWKRYRDHENPLLRRKAEEFRKKLVTMLAILPVGIFGPEISIENRKRYLKLISRVFSAANSREKLWILASPLMATGAIWTWLTLKLDIFQHPFTRRYLKEGRIRSSEDMSFGGRGAALDAVKL